MTYQVLARKWRPRFFDEMMGQEHVLKALINALDNDRLHHAYLFTGTRGVGKTTVARVLAKCLNCEQGVSSKPCGVCSACKAIDEGRFVDLIEVDAASRAKVDETRELMDNVQYAPTVGRYKVYLIDEVHMFSNHSFNALLKTLEEPPPHVKFLLATTEAKKVPVTILSRCLQFNLKHIGVDQIQQQITKILENESVESDDKSCRMIAKAANGSLRDALSLLDQAIAYGGGQLEHNQVQAMLGTIDSSDLIGLVTDLLTGDANAVLEHIARIAEHNPDYDQVLSEMLGLLQNIALLQIAENDSEPELSELAAQSDKEQIQLCYQIALTGRRDLYLSPEPRIGFEMTLIRMLAFQPQPDLPPETGFKAQPEKTKEKVELNTATQLDKATDSPMSANEHPIQSQTASTDDWSALMQQMSLTGLVKELATHCVLHKKTDKQIELYIATGQAHLLNPNQKEKLELAIKKQFGDSMKLIISAQDAETETPAEQSQRKAREQQRLAESSIAIDPNIHALQQAFGTNVDEHSIKPVQHVSNDKT